MLISYVRARSAEFKARRVAARAQTQMIEATTSAAIQRDIDYHKEIGFLGGADDAVVTQETHYEIQARAYRLFYTNPWAHAIIANLTNYVIGGDFQILVGEGAGKEKLQEKYDAWDRKVSFNRRLREMILRAIRDGESFVRRIKPEDIPDHRFIRPGLIVDPDNEDTYGIRTNPKDVETALKYHVMQEGGGEKLPESPIDAKDIWHTKLNVDSEVKRGLTVLKPVLTILPRIPQILEARFALHDYRTNLVAVKTIKGGPAAVARIKSEQQKQRGNTTDSSRIKMPKTGTIEHLSEGIDLEFKSPHFDAADAEHDIRFFLLALVAGTDLFEHAVTGDASNANFASTMVSEAPGVKAVHARQQDFEPGIENEVRNVVKELDGATDVPVDTQWGRVITRDFDKEGKTYVVLNSQGIVSRETSRARLGFDNAEEEERLARENEAEPFDDPEALAGDDLEDEDDE